MARVEAEVLSQAQPDDVSAGHVAGPAHRGACRDPRASFGLKATLGGCRAVPPWSMMAAWIRGSTTTTE